MRSAAVRLALAVVAGSVVYALFRQSYGAALLLTPAEVVGRAWVWQPLTYAFVETSPMGVIFAALVLWQVGGSLEQSWGPRRMVSFAVGTTVVAGLLTVALAFFLSPLAVLSFGGGWVMGIAVWVAFGLMLGRAGTNFWGLPVSGNVLALIGVGFVFLEGAFYGWLLVVPSVLGLLLAAGYLRVGGPEMWWLRLQSWRLQRRLRGRSKHLKVVAPDRNTPGSSDRYLH
jgi:membrane associated rhomboid family serine protease